MAGLFAGVFGRHGESRARTLKEVDFWLRDDVWGSTATDAGVSVTEATAIAVPDVYACLQVISTDVARSPLKFQRRTKDDEWEDAEDHELWDLLRWLANPETSAFDFWSPILRDAQIYGSAYAEIVRRGNGEPYQMWRLDPSRIVVTRPGNRKTYEYRKPTGEVEHKWVFDPERPPLLEIHTWSWVQQCRNLIGLAMALDRYGAKFFANSARPSGVLATAQTLTDAARERLTKSWRAAYGGTENAHRVAVLEAGLEFKPMSAPNDEAQFIESRRFVTERICGAAGVPPHKVAELSRSTNNNIEQQSRDYIERLSPYFVAIEQAIRRDLLTSRSWPRYRAVYDREALVQADWASLAAWYQAMLQNGVFCPNDVRRKLHENPIPDGQGGDLYHMNGNMIPLTATSDRVEGGEGEAA